MTEKESAQLTKIKAFLGVITSKLIAELNNIVQGDYGLYEEVNQEEIAFLDFEVNQDGYSISFYPNDRDWSQLGYKQLLAEFPNGFIRDNKLGLELSDYDFDREADLLSLDNYYENLEQIFFSWFADCWDKADGQTAKYPFFLMAHDADKAFDLKGKLWVNAHERVNE